jgi:hypothetical protein
MKDVPRILSAIEQGDPHPAERLLPLVNSGTVRKTEGFAPTGNSSRDAEAIALEGPPGHGPQFLV